MGKIRLISESGFYFTRSSFNHVTILERIQIILETEWLEFIF